MAAKFRIISGGREASPVHNGRGAKGDRPIASPNTKAAESRAAQTIREVFQSGRPLTYVRSAEEQRVGRVLREVGGKLSAGAAVPVWSWTLTQGMQRDDGSVEAGAQNPRQALDFIAAHKGAGIFHLKDFHEPLRESPEVRRRLR